MSSKINQDLVRHVALLARLKPDDEEVARLADELSAILAYMGRLDELDTTDVPPTAHAVPMVNVWREDKSSASLGVEVVLANAPQSQNGFFRVPKVL